MPKKSAQVNPKSKKVLRPLGERSPSEGDGLGWCVVSAWGKSPVFALIEGVALGGVKGEKSACNRLGLQAFKVGASEGTRTPDPLITNQ